MTVDEYKSKYGDHSLVGFWGIKSVIHSYAIPTRLHELLRDTIKKLNLIYIPYAWSYVKLRKKDDWQEILEIEESINVAIEGENEEYLKEALRMYYEKWASMMKEFEPISNQFTPF